MQRRDFLKKSLKGAVGAFSLPFVARGFGMPATLPPKDHPRQLLEFDLDWMFHRGDWPEASQPSFDDHSWRTLDLPHDWAAEEGFDENHPTGWRGGYVEAGIGWYRKQFEWDPAWKGKKVSLRFDGVYMNSEVWINGQYLGKRPYGYISFAYDLTPFLKQGENTIAVRVDNERVPSCRWYTGSGIYRHVWLGVTDPVHVARHGSFITTPRVAPDEAQVRAEVELDNESREYRELNIQTDILDPDGERVYRNTQTGTFSPGRSTVTETISVGQPQRWSTEAPNLYRAIHTIRDENDRTLDRYETRFGIREVEITAEDGFRLNGKSIKLQGVCNHHDAGPVGAAVPEDVLYRRLKLLKEMGCNAIRTAHNPAAPEFYRMCDELGILVMDEAFDGWDTEKAQYDYGLYFEEWWREDLTELIKRDRNHPSVVIWSIGNEVRGFTEERQKQLVDQVKSLDPTRPVTQGRGYRGRYIDIAGFNGHGEQVGHLEEFHRNNPDKPVIGTEITHTLQTRGIYQTQTAYRRRDFPAPWEQGKSWENYEHNVTKIPDLAEEEVFPDVPEAYQSSYDNAIVRMGVRDQYKRTRKFDWLIGTFRWTGFDYLGEATIAPARTANFGIIDLAGFPKDHYYLYQSLWTDEPMVHLLPHWTHPGKEGVEIPVVAYTNCDTVELLFNEQSLGKKEMTDELQIVWKVPYRPGTLRAVARKNNRVVAETSVATADKPYRVNLAPDKRSMRANRKDVVHVAVDIQDEHGSLVPHADHLVHFEVSGPGRIIGVENGDILDFSSMKAPRRKAFNGKCLLMVQATDQRGTITVAGSAEGLRTDQINITTS